MIKKNVLVISSFLILFASPVSASHHLYFEFFNYQTNAIQSDIPLNTRYETIVATKDPNEDIRNRLPIEITYSMDGSGTTDTIPNNPQKLCRGADGCSIPGIEITNADPNNPPKVIISAKDKDGLAIASYSNTGQSQSDISTDISEEDKLTDDWTKMLAIIWSTSFGTNEDSSGRPLASGLIMWGILLIIITILIILILRGSHSGRTYLDQLLKKLKLK